MRNGILSAILLAGAVVAAAGGIGYREYADANAAAADAERVSAAAAVWRGAVAEVRARSETVRSAMSHDAILVDAVGRRDSDAVRREVGAVLARLSVDASAFRVEIAAADGGRVDGADADADLTMDAGVLERVVAEGREVGGVQQDETRHHVLAWSFPLRAGETTVGTATLTVPISIALRAHGDAAGEPVMLTDLRDNLVWASDPGLWPSVQRSHSSTRSRLISTADGRTLRLVAQSVTDSTGRPIARLITARASTDADAARDARVSTAFVLSVAFGLLTLAALLWYVRAGFLPLQRIGATLEGLADGDVAIEVPEQERRDEIGRMARAVWVLRENAARLEILERSRLKQSRRQQRMIRQQMGRLADTLDAAARDSVLEELARLDGLARQMTAGADGERGAGDDFTLLSAAFDNMSRRIHDQYERLGTLVAELREALEDKRKLIGLEQELHIARQIQQSILPDDPPERPELAIHGEMIPAKEVGGDFYDFFPLDENRIGVAIADVSGKGVPAAFFMAIARTLLKVTALFDMSPGACLEKVNDLLAAGNDQMMFVTLFYGILDLRSGRFHYANAGHNPPMILHPDGRVDALPGTDGTALAVMEGLDYADATVVMEPGDVLFLYTDGVVEAFDIDGVEYTEARLTEVLAELAALPVLPLTEAVVRSVKDFERGAPQADDITCVTLRYRRNA